MTEVEAMSAERIAEIVAIADKCGPTLEGITGTAFHNWSVLWPERARLAKACDPDTILALCALASQPLAQPVPSVVTNPERLELHNRILGKLSDARRGNSGYLTGLLLNRRDADVIVDALLDRAIDAEHAALATGTPAEPTRAEVLTPGLEEAARWHEAEAERIRLIALEADDPHRYHEAQDDHLSHAAFIRSLSSPTRNTAAAGDGK
jgi:hypothetical protein